MTAHCEVERQSVELVGTTICHHYLVCIGDLVQERRIAQGIPSRLTVRAHILQPNRTTTKKVSMIVS